MGCENQRLVYPDYGMGMGEILRNTSTRGSTLHRGIQMPVESIEIRQFQVSIPFFLLIQRL